MRSTFASLETARRALFAQQAALQTTAHNISNANTPGYSRQRVNFKTTLPYATPGLNNPVAPGQVGTGVEAGTVQRVRRDFLDVQFRGENTKYGYWGARSQALSKMENILKEPSEDGLAKAFTRFWESLEDLSNNPENTGTRATVRQRGIALANTFRYLSSSLEQVRGDIQKQLNVSVKEVNSLADQINSLNQQISQVEPHGYLANDLYDKRDLLVDELSNLVNVEVTPVDSGGEALDIAEGRYTIKIVSDTGEKITLVDGRNLRAHHLEVNIDQNDGTATFIMNDNVINGSVSGKLQGLKEANNSDYPEMLDHLDTMASDFVTAFNSVQESGYGLDGETGYQFFEIQTNSGNQRIAQSVNVILDDNELNHIAASNDGSAGDGSNAIDLADVITGSIDLGGVNTTVKDFKDYYEGVIGSMAVEAQEADRLSDSSLILMQSADKRRQSVSGVSVDEEMVNLIKFQHAYNAAGRMVTVVDETLNRIINQMGIVGR
ncbi:MAG TPA: flagellar hook-associated protein FlgK [Bacillales bacterium]|nr:flagellar hook-associated protein FlgK [Bacillales bacterium]